MNCCWMYKVFEDTNKFRKHKEAEGLEPPKVGEYKCYAHQVGLEEDKDCDIVDGDGVWACRSCGYGVAELPRDVCKKIVEKYRKQ